MAEKQGLFGTPEIRLLEAVLLGVVLCSHEQFGLVITNISPLQPSERRL